jgi:hypothetical protein
MELYSQNSQNQDELVNTVNTVNTIVKVYSQLDSFNDTYEENIEELDGLLMQFFQSDFSLSFDISTVLPFSSLISSDDGKIRVFSWFTENGGQAWSYHALIQYKTSEGVLRAEQITNIFLTGNGRDPEVRYSSIHILRSNTYILFGGARAGSHGDVRVCYLTFEIKETGIFPFLAFNGKTYLRFFYTAVTPPDEYLPDFIGHILIVNSFPVTLKLIYAQKDDVEGMIKKEYYFVFNGEEFEGDYSILDR